MDFFGSDDDDDHHFHSFVSEHHRELMAAQSLDSDLEYAFRLQLQEAINASVSLARDGSLSRPHPITNDDATVASSSASVPLDYVSQPKLQSDELFSLQQEAADRKQSEVETRRIREDLDLRVHDQVVSQEILGIHDEDWLDWGDDFHRPFGEGSSKTPATAKRSSENGVFRLYFKGLISQEKVNGRDTILAGIGVAICDPVGNLMFEVSKPLNGEKSKGVAEVTALIEALNHALALDLKRVVVFHDYYPLFQFVTGKWPPKQRKIVMLMNQVSVLRRKFATCSSTMIPRYAIRLAFKLARDAIFSQVAGPAEPMHGKTLNESCVICLEDTDVKHMFAVDGCSHRFCFSCMKQHVEVKLLHGMVPKCPSDGCKTELEVGSCQKFLTPKLIETMHLRIKEASIPAAEKVYCPYPKCSALMSRKDVFEFFGSERTSTRKCLKCHGLFCINCKVPWHSGMDCDLYKKVNPNPSEDTKLKSLASMNLWRQCMKCNHMIELAEGCYHMTCRCGNEFCYNCGAEWKDKKATCSCPLWAEDNILYNDERALSDDDDPFDEHEYGDYWDSDSDDYFL
ncbi:E3 ubiquitin-protein ligase RSL1 [Linum perenne]